MNIIIGIFSILVGVAIWTVSFTAMLAWLAFCFGSVIIGALLLIFAPFVLVAPLAIGAPGTALFLYGMDKLANREEDSIYNNN